MSYTLFTKTRKMPFFFLSEIDRDFLSSVFYRTPAAKWLMFSSHTPGRCPPHTDLRVNSTTLGLVGAPKERAAFRFHDAINHEHCAGFVRGINSERAFQESLKFA